mmetsp:Transcript_21644/g.64810  ORF Transcript_21644/g.64810 Transcript_21644/m.64810 type:complete len:119 (-) Transcript_21644:102-458(-)|eukprot:CAMPEP_0119261862 /NCGR_PEP_ID=MMETSP1329-20130426/1773_1 /TAXON_ID=114041 /ORGANISM="Genus nov. species nov., Strain RCC1024" /LENGTH=118 /DNA_ID=CAMNT_0007261455 /DNA_START=73 /DNA_END=429 /DNA_ORIENTATION=-
MYKALIAALLLAPAAAFAPQQTVRAVGVKVDGYVPNGLTEAQYKAQLAKEKQSAQANKSRFPKGKSFLSMDKWIEIMESKQTFNGDKYVTSGHTYAKNKYATKKQFDAVNGKSKDMWE